MRLSRPWPVGFIVALVWSGTALAHAVPKAEAPAAGTTLRAAPVEVSITFSETVDPHFSEIIVRNADGQHIDDGTTRPDPRNAARLSVGLKQPLAAGAYTVLWHVLAADGHRTQGSYGFTVAP
jgi:methionine-rich copper-binding protein CopC